MLRTKILAAGLAVATPFNGADASEEVSVTVDVLVLDRAGDPVPGLGRDHFEIAVGNRIAPVAGARMVTSDTGSRRFVFVINRRGVPAPQLQRMKRGLEEFVSHRFGDRDEALFVDLAEVPRITSGWRRGRAEALPEVLSLTPLGLPRVTAALRAPHVPAQDVADAVFMLGSLAERLAELPGRKIVVLFSGSLSTFAGEAGGLLSRGTPYVADEVPSSRAGAENALAMLRHAFTAANTSIYALHLEGARRQDEGIAEATRSEIVGRFDTNASERSGSGHDAFMDDIPRGMRRGRDSSASLSGRRRESFSRPTDDFLSSLASDTGGAYIARASDFAPILEDIERTNRLWYELDFVPLDPTAPGSYQPHEVRVRNRPDLKVVFRPGHVVPE